MKRVSLLFISVVCVGSSTLFAPPEGDVVDSEPITHESDHEGGEPSESQRDAQHEAQERHRDLISYDSVGRTVVYGDGGGKRERHARFNDDPVSSVHEFEKEPDQSDHDGLGDEDGDSTGDIEHQQDELDNAMHGDHEVIDSEPITHESAHEGDESSERQQDAQHEVQEHQHEHIGSDAGPGGGRTGVGGDGGEGNLEGHMRLNDDPVFSAHESAKGSGPLDYDGSGDKDGDDTGDTEHKQDDHDSGDTPNGSGDTASDSGDESISLLDRLKNVLHRIHEFFTKEPLHHRNARQELSELNDINDQLKQFSDWADTLARGESPGAHHETPQDRLKGAKQMMEGVNRFSQRVQEIRMDIVAKELRIPDSGKSLMETLSEKFPPARIGDPPQIPNDFESPGIEKINKALRKGGDAVESLAISDKMEKIKIRKVLRDPTLRAPLTDATIKVARAQAVEALRCRVDEMQPVRRWAAEAMPYHAAEGKSLYQTLQEQFSGDPPQIPNDSENKHIQKINDALREGPDALHELRDKVIKRFNDESRRVAAQYNEPATEATNVLHSLHERGGTDIYKTMENNFYRMHGSYHLEAGSFTYIDGVTVPKEGYTAYDLLFGIDPKTGIFSSDRCDNILRSLADKSARKVNDSIEKHRTKLDSGRQAGHVSNAIMEAVREAVSLISYPEQRLNYETFMVSKAAREDADSSSAFNTMASDQLNALQITPDQLTAVQQALADISDASGQAASRGA